MSRTLSPFLVLAIAGCGGRLAEEPSADGGADAARVVSFDSGAPDAFEAGAPDAFEAGAEAGCLDSAGDLVTCCGGAPCRGTCDQGRCICVDIPGGCWSGTVCCPQRNGCSTSCP